MKSVGLDVGSYAIKVASGKLSGDKLGIELVLEEPNPAGTLLPADPQLREQLVEKIKQIWQVNDLPTRNIRASLPESTLVTKVINMPKLSDAELASAIHWQIEQHIPIPYEELQYEYTVLRRIESESEPSMDVLVIGVQKNYVQGVADLFLEAGLDVTSLESDTIAQLRCLESNLPVGQNNALLYIGATNSTVNIISDNVLSLVYTFPIAGFLFTRSIEQALQLSPARAEEYKRSFGLLEDQMEGKIRNALLPTVRSLVAEVQKAIHYFQSQHIDQSINKLYVYGGSQYLPDLFTFLSENLGLEVAPVRLLEQSNLIWPNQVAQDSRFVTALGLALKDIKG